MILLSAWDEKNKKWLLLASGLGESHKFESVTIAIAFKAFNITS